MRSRISGTLPRSALSAWWPVWMGFFAEYPALTAAAPGVLLEGRASRNRVCSIVSGGFFRRSFSGLRCVLILHFFCGGFFFTMIRYDTTFFMGIQSSPRRVATQYQDPMWPRRHTHRSPMFVEIFGHWWHSQRHASNQAITLANSGWIPAR